MFFLIFVVFQALFFVPSLASGSDHLKKSGNSQECLNSALSLLLEDLSSKEYHHRLVQDNEVQQGDIIDLVLPRYGVKVKGEYLGVTEDDGIIGLDSSRVRNSSDYSDYNELNLQKAFTLGQENKDIVSIQYKDRIPSTITSRLTKLQGIQKGDLISWRGSDGKKVHKGYFLKVHRELPSGKTYLNILEEIDGESVVAKKFIDVDLLRNEELITFSKKTRKALRGLSFKTQNIFYEKDLSIVRTFEYDGAILHLSSIFKVERRSSALMIIERGAEKTAINIYHSQSQGLFFISNKIRVSPRHYYKGHGKHFMLPPPQVQDELLRQNNNLPFSTPHLTINELHLFEADTATGLSRDIQKIQRVHAMNFQAAKPFPYDALAKRPEQIEFKNLDDAPDLSKISFLSKTVGPLFGEANIYKIPSKNQRYNFLVFRLPTGEVWVGGVEYITDPKLELTLTTTSHYSFSAIIKPLWEYSSQVHTLPGERYPLHPLTRSSSDPYVNQWPYIKKIPVINDIRLALDSFDQSTPIIP